MLVQTKGIIFRTIKYSESSVIADIFTEEKGLMSYIISGVRKARSRTQASLLMPLSILDLVVYHTDRNKLHRIKELKPAHVFRSIPFDVRKASISLFLSELCSKTVRDTEAQPELFRFIEQQVLHLDEEDTAFMDCHLHFMIGFADQLGFGIHPGQTVGKIFDMMHGTFTDTEPPHPYWSLNGRALSGLLAREDGTTLSRKDRNLILDDLITFFRLHIEGMKALNAHNILRQVL